MKIISSGGREGSMMKVPYINYRSTAVASSREAKYNYSETGHGQPKPGFPKAVSGPIVSNS